MIYYLKIDVFQKLSESLKGYIFYQQKSSVIKVRMAAPNAAIKNLLISNSL